MCQQCKEWKSKHQHQKVIAYNVLYTVKTDKQIIYIWHVNERLPLVGRLCLLRMQQRKGSTGMEQGIASLTHTSFWKTNQHQGQNHSCFLYFEDSTPGHLGWEMKRSQRTDATRQHVVGWIEGWCLTQSLWVNLCMEVGSLKTCLSQKSSHYCQLNSMKLLL